MPWYHVAEPNSYLVVTGVGIEKVKIQKKVSLLLQHFQYSILEYQDMYILITIGIRIPIPESIQDQHHTFRLFNVSPGHDYRETQVLITSGLHYRSCR